MLGPARRELAMDSVSLVAVRRSKNKKFRKILFFSPWWPCLGWRSEQGPRIAAKLTPIESPHHCGSFGARGYLPNVPLVVGLL